MTVHYYDRDGNETDLAGFAAGQVNYRVAEDNVGDYRVSTVWLGLASNATGPPLIFETMVFVGGGGEEVDCERYPTEADALDGHNRMVEKWASR